VIFLRILVIFEEKPGQQPAVNRALLKLIHLSLSKLKGVLNSNF